MLNYVLQEVSQHSKLSQTPCKTLDNLSLCFICQKPQRGQLRNIITNVALPENNKVLHNIKDCFDVDLAAEKNVCITQCKICLTCRRHLDMCLEFRNNLLLAISRKPSTNTRTKRMAHTQTPSSSTKDKSNHQENKENKHPYASLSNPKKKKKLQFSDIDVTHNTNTASPKEHGVVASDHSYGSLLTPSEMAKSYSVESHRDFFKKKDEHRKEIDCCTAEEIFQNKTKMEKIHRLILFETELICDKLCSTTILPGPSVLRTCQKPAFLKSEDILSKCIIEFQNCLPFIFKIFQTMSSSIFKDPENASASNSTIAMMYGMAMNKRNKDLCALQKINTCVALRFHAGNDLLDIFNKSNITLAAGSKYGFLDEMKLLNTDGIIRSIKERKPGKITADNIDGMTIARDVRLTGGNKHYHYTASTYYPDRVDVSSLEHNRDVPDGIDINAFLLNEDEEMKLKEMYGYMVGAFIKQHIYLELHFIM